MKKFLLLFSGLMFLTCTYAAGIDFRAGVCGAKFLKIGLGARPAALGGAFTAAGDDIASIYWNPAGISSIESSAISASHNEWLTDIALENISYIKPIGGSVIGASILYMRMGDITARDTTGNATGSFSAYSAEAVLSYGSNVSPGICLGINAKSFTEVLENEQASGFAFDLGLIHTGTDEKWSTGICIQNLGPWFTFIAERESLPQQVTIGMGYRILDNNMLITVDAAQPYDNAAYLAAGIEYSPADVFSIRAGYNSSTAQVSGGCGFKILNWLIDYTYAPYGTLDTVHHITLSTTFPAK